MCGRFTLTASPEAVARHFELEETPELAPRFNIAPGQDVATVDVDEARARRVSLRRWGLVPHWARDPRVGSRMINARAETLAEKPAFRDAFARRRCLVPADGFFEWAGAARGARQPWYVGLRGRGLFAFAGLHERWREPEGGWLRSCTLVTTEANARLRPLHDRMPVILPPEAWSEWLDPAVADPERLGRWLRPLPDDAIEFHAVGRRVNRVELDDPECIAPVEPEPSVQGSLF